MLTRRQIRIKVMQTLYSIKDSEVILLKKITLNFLKSLVLILTLFITLLYR